MHEGENGREQIGASVVIHHDPYHGGLIRLSLRFYPSDKRGGDVRWVGWECCRQPLAIVRQEDIEATRSTSRY